IMREYLPMQLEKDERVYGGFDAAVRANMGNKAEQRWLEVLKPFVHTTTYLEGCAGRVMSMLLDTVPNDELRNGYHVQFVDELRHIGMQQSLARWYAKNAPNPAGWDMGAKYYTGSPLTKEDLASSWSANHAFIGPFAGVLIEYFSKDRSDQESYLEKWNRWVNDDYYKSYIEQLGKLGLDMDPSVFLGARDRIEQGLI